jgi:hypothetical protein
LVHNFFGGHQHSLPCIELETLYPNPCFLLLQKLIKQLLLCMHKNILFIYLAYHLLSEACLDNWFRWLYYCNYFIHAFRVVRFEYMFCFLYNTCVYCPCLVWTQPVIFFQWADCVSQLLRMYPFAFEFSAVCVSLNIYYISLFVLL